jgi:nucleotide-binding universal stress UspA family protein
MHLCRAHVLVGETVSTSSEHALKSLVSVVHPDGTVMIKDLVVNLTIGAERDYAAEFAISVAEVFSAHIAGIAFAYEPVLPPSVMGGIPANYIEAQRADAEKAASDAVARYEEKARLAGVSVESRVMGASLAGASDLFGRVARRFDLSVVGQAEPDKVAAEDLIIETALFESGRPVVVVPYIQRAGLTLDRVMIGWDGSKNAARAIADALPFLSRAKSVDVVIVASDGVKSDELPGADIAQHLARHGLTVEVKRIVSGGIDVANTVLSYAADSAIDFIVMGGYGHSRLREFILGGATRGILTSMTVPVLMSH